MGANAELLDAAYATHTRYQRASFASPGLIDSANFGDHLGDADYYQAYLAYFSKEVLKNGVPKTLEECIFAKEVNHDGKRQEMLSRFLGGVLHAAIHVGYGLEFGLLNMSAEGELSIRSDLTSSDEEHRVCDGRCRNHLNVLYYPTIVLGR